LNNDTIYSIGNVLLPEPSKPLYVLPVKKDSLSIGTVFNIELHLNLILAKVGWSNSD
jgi:hypothetical protein